MKKTLPNGLAAAALLLPGSLFAQMTGTSHPENLNDNIVSTSSQSSHYVPPAKPSPSVRMQATDPAVQQTTTPVLVQRAPASAFEPQQATSYETAQSARLKAEEGEGVVLDVPSLPNELPAGMLIHTSLSSEISTVINQRGESFSVKLLHPLMRKSEVLVPTGSIINGRIAQIHAGNRLHGGPAIQLIPEYVVLPDGSRHHLEAQVVDLPTSPDAKVSGEGVIRGKDNIKRNAISAGAMTGTATVAGAMIGGGVGAAVGAGVGAGVATVWWLRHEQEQTLRENTEIVFSLDRPLLLAPVVR